MKNDPLITTPSDNLDFPAAVKQLEEAIEVARAKTTAEEK